MPSVETITDPKKLKERIAGLERDLARERLAVRQLQDRLRSKQGDPKAKLDKALKLILNIVGKDRLRRHLDVNKGDTRTFLESLIHETKDEFQALEGQHVRNRGMQATATSRGRLGATQTQVSSSPHRR